MKRQFAALALLLPGLLPTAAQANTSAQAPFEIHPVPAISSLPRLPDRVPSDSPVGDRVALVAAQGEMIPGSFVVVPKTKVAELELSATDLKTAEGATLPASIVDLRVVKCWYQAGTAWYSYFADNNRRELVPELLLKDETLIRVDAEKKENFLRVGGSYESISYSFDEAEGAFNYLTADVADAETLQPVTLAKGESKQIWITIKVPDDAKPGLYQGSILLKADGKPQPPVTIQLRVLPFSLPLPRTYYDLEKDFLVTIYATDVLELSRRQGLPSEEADRIQMLIYRNLLEHGVYNPFATMSYTQHARQEEEVADMRREIALMRKAGFGLKPFLSRAWGYYAPVTEEKDPEKYRERIKVLAGVLKEEIDHGDIYIATWDEADANRVRIMRELAKIIHGHGLKIWSTVHRGRHFDLAGYSIDYANHGGWPTREQAAEWHAVGAKIASYAGPHTGPENPDIFRRMEGLARYKANYDGSMNYKYFSQLHPTISERLKQNVWNDFVGGPFRQFNMVHPTRNGMIDTIAWEGFREGIDDIRYATKLKMEAEAAMKSDSVNAAHTAKKALMWLELLDDQTVDLNYARQEIIEWILKIQAAMKSPSQAG